MQSNNSVSFVSNRDIRMQLIWLSPLKNSVTTSMTIEISKKSETSLKAEMNFATN